MLDFLEDYEESIDSFGDCNSDYVDDPCALYVSIKCGIIDRSCGDGYLHCQDWEYVCQPESTCLDPCYRWFSGLLIVLRGNCIERISFSISFFSGYFSYLI